LKTQFPDTQVLFLAVDEDANVLRDAVKAGASGYMIMRAAGEELIQALHTVSRRELYIHPAMTRRLLQDFTVTADPNPSAIHQLTRREVEVLHYIVRGYTSRQIADTLFLSDRTVIGYRSSLMDKLKVKNRVELVELAQKHGLF
jgi:two-component system response regulator NreC